MSCRNAVGRFFRLLFAICFVGLIIAGYFAVQPPPGLPGIPADADQQAANFERKIIFLEQQWAQKEGAEVGVSAAEINAAYARSGGDTMLVAFAGSQTMLFLVKKIWLLDIYISAAGKIGVNQRRVTFTPADLKIGTISIPHGLANSLIQEKLRDPAMQEQLRLPAFISTVKIKDSQLMLGTSPTHH